MTEPQNRPAGGWGGAAKVVTERIELRPLVDEIEALGDEISIPEAGVRGVFCGGTEMSPQNVRFLCEEILDLERLGALDNFFELGGHSLLATQVMSRINKLFNIQLPLRRFFEATTIETLAEVIDNSLWNAQGLQKPGITGIEEREVIEL